MLACEVAPGCDSFAYNPVQEKCFLKSGAIRQTCRAVPTMCVSARGQSYSCGVWQTYFRTGGAAPAGTGTQPAGSGGKGTSSGNGSDVVPLLPSTPTQAQAASVQLLEALQRP